MKKIIITLAALSALSTGALAARDDHGRDTDAMTKFKAASTQTLVIKSGIIDADRYLNKSQLR